MFDGMQIDASSLPGLVTAPQLLPAFQLDAKLGDSFALPETPLRRDLLQRLACPPPERLLCPPLEALGRMGAAARQLSLEEVKRLTLALAEAVAASDWVRGHKGP